MALDQSDSQQAQQLLDEHAKLWDLCIGLLTLLRVVTNFGFCSGPKPWYFTISAICAEHMGLLRKDNIFDRRRDSVTHLIEGFHWQNLHNGAERATHERLYLLCDE